LGIIMVVGMIMGIMTKKDMIVINRAVIFLKAFTEKMESL